MLRQRPCGAFQQDHPTASFGLHGVCVILILLSGSVTAAADPQRRIEFDVLPVVAAQVVDGAPFESVKRVEVPLRVSTRIDVDRRTTIEELYFEVRFITPHVAVLDYDPKTQLASDIEGAIEVQVTDEESKSLGTSVKGTYHGIVSAQGGLDVGSKSIDTRKYRQVPEQQTIAASGTLDRGRGAFFKFRRASQQSLEGDKFVTVVIEVPSGWRAGLIDLSVAAEGTISSGLGLGNPQRTTIRQQRFLVATHLATDISARRACWQLAEAELEVRRVADAYAAKIQDRAYPTVFHQIGAALTIVSPEIPLDWLQRSLFDSIDPYFDSRISQLPVDVRVAVMDYMDAKQQVGQLNGPS